MTAILAPTALRTVRVLYRHEGEYSNTAYTPVREMAAEEILPETKVGRILNSDNWMPVEIPEFKVLERSLPEWLTTAEWIRTKVEWSYIWGAVGVPMEWPEAWQRKIKALGANARTFALVKLLTQKTVRSSFRASIKSQATGWLNGETTFETPLSAKQSGALVNQWVAREWKSAESNAYYGHRYSEI